MKTVRATIRWIKPDEGGRRHPPSGEGTIPYSTIVRFLGEPWPPQTAWSLLVEKVRAVDPFTWDANIRFLFPEAPEDLLTLHKGFELYEGNKCVAHGAIESPALVANRRS